MTKQKEILSIIENCKNSILLGSILFNPITIEFTFDDRILSYKMVKDMITNKLIIFDKEVEFQNVKYLRYIKNESNS